MLSGRVEISIGQWFRALTHVRHFKSALQDPGCAQARKLMQIVRANERCMFGKRHHFDKISSIQDFQSLVPPACYEDLYPYLEKSMNGERKQLTSEEPFMYATTSGTTAKPKFIPITKAHLRDYTHAFQIHNYHMIQDYPDRASGRFLIVSSNDEEGQLPNGLPYGAVSGLLYRKQPPVIRKYFALPYEICKIKDVDAKYYLMLRMALPERVTAILCCNPSSLLLLADQLREHAGDLIKDVHDGTIKECYRPPAALANAFEEKLTPNPDKARALERMLSNYGRLLPKVVWPDLGVISCWKGGPMSFYLEQLLYGYGDIPVRDFGYMASEGRGTIPLTSDGAGGVAALTSHFFEFVAEEDMESNRPTFLTLEQIQLHKRYYVYFTTAAGLYRYNINDLVEVVGFYERTPVIQFVRKGLGVSSITGEKLTEEQVRVALCYAVRQLKLNEIKHFTACVQLSHPPHYCCFVELSGNLPESLRNEFLRIFDQSLQLQNPEYQDKRGTKRLGAPSFMIVPQGTYTKLRQQRVLEGAPEAQVKLPLLSCRNDFGDRIAALAESGTDKNYK
ncbi:MAG: GH3 auxin-responsive promoter family protein [Candidatus Melainabacteria bacterium]|nr:GH3 auxin-responsive promoter family protein [Candidatus Melainabacteria bacterium]